MELTRDKRHMNTGDDRRMSDADFLTRLRSPVLVKDDVSPFDHRAFLAWELEQYYIACNYPRKIV